MASKVVLAEDFHSHLESHVLCTVCGFQSFGPSCFFVLGLPPPSLIAASAAPNSVPAPTPTTVTTARSDTSALLLL